MLTSVPLADPGTPSNDNPFPPPVIVQSLSFQIVKIGPRKKGRTTTELIFQFSGALNAGAAQNLGIYHLLQATRHKKGGTK